MAPSSGPTRFPSGVRLKDPETGIRFLLSIPSSVSSAHAQQGRPIVITDKVVKYLDGRSATHLLTSCRHLKEFSITHALYALLLKRDFTALHRPLVPKVSAQPKAQQWLVLQRLYAMSHGPDPEPQIFRGHTNRVYCLTQLADGSISSGSYDHTVRIWGKDPASLFQHALFPLKQTK